MRKNILDFVEIDDLQSDLRPAAQTAGIEAVRALLVELEGVRVLFGSYSTQASIRRRYALANYIRQEDGSDNLLSIARSLGVTPRTVKRYLQR